MLRLLCVVAEGSRPSMSFKVYEASFRCSDDAWYTYVGMTEGSLVARRRWHLTSRKGWLDDMVESSLRLRTCVTCETRDEALAQEALVAARAISAQGEEYARGGPWCLSHLRAEHRKETDKVLLCRWAEASTDHTPRQKTVNGQW